MKNKFKKSKIIVPALALITATTVASVTGTVAWFTANQTVTVKGTKFAVANLEGELKVSSKAGIGTKLTDTSETDGSIEVSATGMADASYNGTNVFTDKENTNGSATEFVQIDDNCLAATGYYYAVSWTETFKVDLSTGQTQGTSYNIYFNPKTSKGTAVTDHNTKQALRVSMQAGTGPRIIFAPFQTAALTASTGYVKSTTSKSNYVEAQANTTYSSDNIYAFTTDAKWTLANASSSTDAAKRIDYLGTTSTNEGATVTTLDVKFVAWFEGLDTSTNISENEDLANVSLDLGFYARAVTSA